MTDGGRQRDAGALWFQLNHFKFPPYAGQSRDRGIVIPLIGASQLIKTKMSSIMVRYRETAMKMKSLKQVMGRLNADIVRVTAGSVMIGFSGVWVNIVHVSPTASALLF